MSENISLDLVLSYKDTKELVKTCILSQEPIMIHGKPGIGKSAMVKELSKDFNRPMIDYRACLSSEVDVKGYPFIDPITNTMKFAMTNELPKDPNSNAILFLDEINLAPPSTQFALYQLILDRRIGEYVLPKGVSIVAAGNTENDRAGIFSMPKPLENRFVHVEMEVNFNQWLEYALTKGIHRYNIAFLSNNNDKLMSFNPEVSSRGFGTPRSWEKFSDLLLANPNASKTLVHNLCAGCVGVGLASQFMGFLEVTDKLPDPMDILSGKQKTIDRLEASLCYAVVTNLLYKLKELNKENPEDDNWDQYANNFFEFMMNNEQTIGAEFLAVCISIGYSVYKLPFKAKRLPLMMKAIEKYNVLLEGI